MKKVVRFAWIVLWLIVLWYVSYNYFTNHFITTLDQPNQVSSYSLYIYIWFVILMLLNLFLMYTSTTRKKLKMVVYNLILILVFYYFLSDTHFIWNRDISILYVVITFFLSLFGIFSPKKFANTVADIVESKWNYNKKVEIIEV